MKRLLLLFFISFFIAKTQAQYTLDKKEYNFGDILADHDRVVDFILTNTGKEDFYFLKFDVPEDCAVRYSRKVLAPDSSAIIRIKFNPSSTGKFERIISFYYGASTKPVELKISGNVKELPNDIVTTCPDFNDTKEQKQITTQFTVTVLDAETDKPITGAYCPFTPDLGKFKLYLTDVEGKFSSSVPIGIYDINVSAKNYLPAHQRMYIGREERGIVFRLERVYVAKETVKKDEVLQQKDSTLKTEIITRKEENKNPNPDKPGELNHADYLPNNIVFLIDVSSSMDAPDKLPLLKEAMLKVAGSLRDVDKLTIVTYASGTEVVMPTTTADNKRKISRVIKELKPGGFTQGGKGIRLAYQMAEESMITGGNNQIFVATDGDFNLDKSDDALYKFIEAHSQKGIRMTVVGCGKNPRAKKKMQKIADKGNGSLVEITTGSDYENSLLEEIKLRARK